MKFDSYKKEIAQIPWAISFFILLATTVLLFSKNAQAATTIPFTVNLSEVVNVTGTPRIAVNVGGVTRYANYTSGTGTSALTFTYAMVTGDVDLDGVTLVSPMELNGGTIRDIGENNATLTFTLPNTSNVRVNYPSLGMDFVADADGRYTLNSTIYNNLPSFLTATGGTFTRSSIGTYFDSTGTLQTASSNTPRFDYDPATLQPKGILIEEQRTNAIRNSIMQNTIAGNPGTMPTNWAAATPSNGLSRRIVGTGIVNGMSYIDIQYSGTASATGFSNIVFESSNQIAALNTQTWTHSAYISLVGGSISNLTNIRLRVAIFSSVPSYLQEIVTNGTALEGINSTLTRYSGTGTIANASSAFIQPYLQFTYTTGLAVNFTVRIAAPQLEQGSFATSFIPTTTAAVTRNIDILSIPIGAWYNPNAGAMFGDVAYESSTGINYPMMMRFDNGTNTERWNFFFNQNIQRIGFDGYTLSVGQGSQHFGPVATSGSAKLAAAQELNNTNAAYSGVLGTLDTSWNPPALVNRLYLRNEAPGNKWMKNFKYYPLRITDTQLQLMTQ